MRRVSKSWGVLARLLAFVALAGLCLTLIVNALTTPITDKLVTYRVVFSDASGLMVGNDVRMSGVQVGKVEKISVENGTAKVKLTVSEKHPVFDNTKVAVRYQSLVGQRYIEMVLDDKDGAPLPGGTEIPVERTIPSFDVSALFNGLRPLFETLQPADLNRFGENLLLILQGDGKGVGPALEDVRKLTTQIKDSDGLIALMIENLGAISKEIGGKSKQVGEFVEQVDKIVGNVADKSDVIIDSSVVSNETLTRVADLFVELESTYDDSYGPLDAFLRRVFPPTQQIADALAMLPSLLNGFRVSTAAATDTSTFTCAKGRADLPGIGRVLLANQRLVVCK